MSDEAAALPDLAEVLGWRGLELDDAAGRTVGRVEGVFADAESNGPAWLVVAVGRRRRAKSVAVPVRECAAMPSRVWTAQSLEAVRGAHAVDPMRPLLREHEQAISLHYGVGERVGRHAEVIGRPGGSVTARPAGWG